MSSGLKVNTPAVINSKRIQISRKVIFFQSLFGFKGQWTQVCREKASMEDEIRHCVQTCQSFTVFERLLLVWLYFYRRLFSK